MIPMKSRSLLAVALAMFAASSLLAQPKRSAAAIDAHYLGLYEDGKQFLEDGKPALAAQSLRLACFGMLEVPNTLAGCLARLAIAEIRSEDRDAFAETFRRLAIVEERFHGYSQAELPAAERVELEKNLVRHIPEQQLAAVPTFQPLAVRRMAVKISRMAPKERRARLDELVKAEPGNARWRTLLADLELEEGNVAPALSQIDAALAADPTNVQAHCLKGLTSSIKGECPAAVAELAACEAVKANASYAEALLSCQTRLGLWSEAAAILAGLPEDLTEDRRITKLARQIEKRPPSAAPPSSSPPPAPPSATPAPPPASTPVKAPPAAKVSTPEELAKQLEEIRQRAARVQHTGQLVEPLKAAAELAAANPELPEAQFVAAEVAYRASHWQEAADYFRRGGDPGDAQPVRLFYWAVALYESGAKDEAAKVLTRALPKLDKIEIVESYRGKILGKP